MWQRKGPASTLLLPLAWITGRVVAARKRRAHALPPSTAALPTIVVGNLLVGGTGKTPVVIAVVKNLQGRGWTPGVVSRGYGVNVGTEPRTDQGNISADDFGDEPALIARSTGAPVAVHPQRKLAREALVTGFPDVDVVVSDDGLQHLALSRDVEIVVQDARGIGNGRLLPAGPLREPAAKLAEVDFIVNNSLPENDGLHIEAAAHNRPEQISMRLQPMQVEHLAGGETLAWSGWLDRHRGHSLAAVAAIGQPKRFFDMLREAGLRLGHAVALPDHDAYEHSPFSDLPEDLIVITAKDAVKCARFSDPRVWVVHVEARFSDPGWLDRLASKLENRQKNATRPA